MHLVPNRTQLFFMEIIVNSHAVVRNNIEIPCRLYPVSPSDDILQNYRTKKSLTGILTKIQTTNVTSLSPVLFVLISVLIAFLSPMQAHASTTTFNVSNPRIPRIYNHSSPPPSQPPAIISLPVISKMLSLKECYVNGIIQLAAFQDWVLFHSE